MIGITYSLSKTVHLDLWTIRLAQAFSKKTNSYKSYVDVIVEQILKYDSKKT